MVRRAIVLVMKTKTVLNWRASVVDVEAELKNLRQFRADRSRSAAADAIRAHLSMVKPEDRLDAAEYIYGDR